MAEHTVWNTLRVTPPATLLDPLAGLFMDLGAEGTWEDGADLVAYFPPTLRPDEVELALTAWLGHMEACGVAVFAPECIWKEEGEGDWITAWKAHFSPIPVGRIMVLPEWEDDAKGLIPLKIRPGRGFGTGGHDTTATCLRRIQAFLEHHPNPAAVRVLDVGTGSGILAIAARLLGAGHVTGFDNDPDAVENAHDNAALNGVDIGLFTGTLDRVTEQYDLVLANLLAHVIVELMPGLARALAPGGRLILSGILNEQGDRIDQALAKTGLKAVNYESRGMWLTIDAERA